MTLEDFFTLTEMKDGLSSLGRVEELVSGMKKEKNCAIKNFGDAARQWSTVAAILAATDNADCLDHFVRLEGLCFLDQWLQEAQKYNGDARNDGSEEAISALLGALEKLPINRERSAGSGIGITVKHLFGHKSMEIQKRARNLLEGWTQVKETSKKSDVGKDGGGHEIERKHSTETKLIVYGGSLKTAVPSAFPPKGTSSDRCSDTLDSGSSQVKVANLDMFQNKSISDANRSSSQAGVKANGYCAMVHKVDAVAGASVALSVEGSASASSCVSLTARERSDNKASTVSEPDVGNGSLKERTESVISGREGSSCKSSVTVSLEKEEKSVSNTSVFPSHIGYPKGIDEATLSCKSDANDCNTSPRKSSVVLGKDGTHELHSRNKTMSMVDPKPEGQIGYVNSVVCSSGVAGTLNKFEGPEVFPRDGDSFMKASHEKGSRIEANVKIKADESAFATTSHKMLLAKGYQKNVRDPEKKLSETRLGCGTDDEILECARQVVKDLEKEVGIYVEPLHSSHDGDNGNNILVKPTLPESNIHAPEEPPSDLPIQRNEQLAEVSSSDVGQAPQEAQNLEQGKDTQIHEQDSSQSKPASQELGSVVPRCGFDLNEDVLMVEDDRPKAAHTNHPIKVIAASKGVAGLPVTPLHFEGELGWKGTAATSAFRPASPRKIVEVEKADASTHTAKQSQNVLKIDLNVADGDLDVTNLPPSGKQIPFTSNRHPGDSSTEVNSKRVERLNLDLNRVDDDDGCQYQSSDWRIDRNLPQQQNGPHFPSPASSSSSSRQSAMRNIDLNDNPTFLDPCSYDQQKIDKFPFQPLKSFADRKLDDPVVSIMGSRMDVERKDFPSPAQPFFVSGQGGPLSSLAATSGRVVGEAPRSTLAYTTAQLPFAYNGLAVGPAMSLSSAVYTPGHLPYMVDTRGATVIPQILAPPVPSAFSRPPFFMSVTSTPSGMNGVGVMRPSLDLNSGMSLADSDKREGVSRPVFIHGHGPLIDETGKTTGLQVAGSGPTLKRKEPECGWEPYPVGFKQLAPWHA
ncbi:uncharacterized protein LOC116260360 [Nymphaea colorata]|uniref:TFIIS N-terminal domain-containing protein n=1 Tax=Nymphaea colorata TaxID=210225 RepID=A0A5K1H455_9MAGN|nr:uncharacterized protein LOC116260360 [Nymphaea colorata]